jgi:hypothetical protein
VHLDVEHAADVLLRGLLDGAEVAVPGVVDDRVDPAEARDGGIDGPRHVRGIGELHLERQQVRRVGISEGGEQPVAGARRRGDPVPGGEERLHEMQAESPGCTGDEPRGGAVGGGRGGGHGGPSGRC